MNEETKIDELPQVSSLLTGTIRGGTKITDVHLKELSTGLAVEDTRTSVNCYRLPIDKHGRVRFKPLAEFLRERIVDYAIPRRRIDEAKKHLNETGSTAQLSKLEKEAKKLFTSLSQSGEGGELMVFAFAEAVFGLSQIICKMSLKTSTEMHYHGADGVYAEGTDDGGLNVYWGESKLYGDPSDAVRDCLKSLAPFLIDPDGDDSARSQDVFLINEFASFDDPKLTEGLKRYFDLDDQKSLSLHHCGIALIGFDTTSYLKDGENSDELKLEAELNEQIPAWVKQIKNRVGKENIASYDINFICVPMRTVEEFRKYFLSLLES
ncbi:DUF1837 domain-containing protein [Parvularcula flava]|uniref:DUF1837 domain-containing protein n=1 Tax=Aquisalinus luteolus TaxID=1566827 RepID=A0A8J3A7E3_9PROT|nr:DUF1837 domain-containing protein [Aquisalinus luteolus]NHK27923.1 DUF1837 domain-containing protein [Aquisalinus luteolus]GGH96936.1 hypothetical protein GCM10011355_16940 [Aquisalinus luteolus]